MPEDVDGGQVFGYGAADLMGNGSWTTVHGEFKLSDAGDIIHLYCMEASGAPKPLLAFNYGGIFTAPELNSYDVKESALPDNLGEAGVVNLPHLDNYFYDGPSDELSDDEIKAAVRDPINWVGSDSQRFGLTDAQSGGAMLSIRSCFTLAAALTALSWAM
jgi:hypothetical protein